MKHYRYLYRKVLEDGTGSVSHSTVGHKITATGPHYTVFPTES